MNGLPLKRPPWKERFVSNSFAEFPLNAYRGALKTSLSPTIRLVELETHINNETFALVAANLPMVSLGASVETRTARSPR
jgi:hypothetical protein